MKTRVLFLTLLPTLAAPALAAAGPYADVELAREHQTFRPHYDFAQGWPSQTYLDTSEAWALALRGGYAWQLSDRVELAAQLRYAHANNDWALQTTEPASLSFRIPKSLQAGAVGRVQVLNGLDLTAELFLGTGQVHETKSAPTASNYGFDRWVTSSGWALGAGHAFSDSLSLHLEYRSTRYGSFVHTSARPGSTAVVETIRDRPYAEDVALALRYRW